MTACEHQTEELAVCTFVCHNGINMSEIKKNTGILKTFMNISVEIIPITVFRLYVWWWSQPTVCFHGCVQPWIGQAALSWREAHLALPRRCPPCYYQSCHTARSESPDWGRWAQLSPRSTSSALDNLGSSDQGTISVKPALVNENYLIHNEILNWFTLSRDIDWL